MTDFIVVVRGGSVVKVCAKNTNCSVALVDWDHRDGGRENDAECVFVFNPDPIGTLSSEAVALIENFEPL